MGAQPDVLATSLGPYAQAFLQIGDRAGQVRGPVDEMIDQHDLIIPRTHSHRTQGARRWTATPRPGPRSWSIGGPPSRGTARPSTPSTWRTRSWIIHNRA